jgi:integrase
MAGKLTQKFIEGLARRVAAGAKEKEWHSDGQNGLYVRVSSSGRLSFEIRARPWPNLTVGPVEIGLATARQIAAETVVSRAKGVDPAAEKKAARDAAKAPKAAAVAPDDSFEAIAGRYIERAAKPHLRSWRDIERALQRDCVPAWKGVPIGQITRPMIGELLDQIVDRGAPRQASITRLYLSGLFAWAVGRGYADENLVEKVPVPSKAVSRDRVLSDPELALIWRAADSAGYPFGPIVKLLMLSGQRKGEIANGRWSEIDMAARLWSLPPARVKNGKAHTFPLSAPALVILEALPRIEVGQGKDRALSDLIFTTTGATTVSGFTRAFTNLNKAIAAENDGKPLPHWTLHDLRRTAATRMGDLGVLPHVIEAVLNHISGHRAGVAGVYNRAAYEQEKREALDILARHILTITGESPPSNVVSLPKRRAQ